MMVKHIFGPETDPISLLILLLLLLFRSCWCNAFQKAHGSVVLNRDEI